MLLGPSDCKLIGYTLGRDMNTVVGPPRPIHQSIKTLNQPEYMSIAEVQVQIEEECLCSPLGAWEEEDTEQVPAETLCPGLLPSLPQCMLVLLKILPAQLPPQKPKETRSTS